MARMNKARLLKLADFLAALKEDDKTKFDMGRWGSRELVLVDEKGPECVEICMDSCSSGPIEVTQGVQVYECKTTACALGFGTQIPSFQRAGLSMEFSVKKLLPNKTISGEVVLRQGGHKIRDPMLVARKFFGISDKAAYYLFGGGGSHTTPKGAAKEIRKFVEGKIKGEVWSERKQEYIEVPLFR